MDSNTAGFTGVVVHVLLSTRDAKVTEGGRFQSQSAYDMVYWKRRVGYNFLRKKGRGFFCEVKIRGNNFSYQMKRGQRVDALKNLCYPSLFSSSFLVAIRLVAFQVF